VSGDLTSLVTRCGAVRASSRPRLTIPGERSSSASRSITGRYRRQGRAPVGAGGARKLRRPSVAPCGDGEVLKSDRDPHSGRRCALRRNSRAASAPPWLPIRSPDREKADDGQPSSGGLRLCRELGRHAGRGAGEHCEDLPPPHSITSSAWAWMVKGIVSPSALAICMLITNSNLVGCMSTSRRAVKHG
jgi:hypothetical protein